MQCLLEGNLLRVASACCVAPSYSHYDGTPPPVVYMRLDEAPTLTYQATADIFVFTTTTTTGWNYISASSLLSYK